MCGVEGRDFSDGKFHLGGDLPAVIWADGAQEWYKYGKHYRDGDLPAVICADGTQRLYKYWKWHRDGTFRPCSRQTVRSFGTAD